MVSKDQAIGWIILIVCIIVIVGYPTALYVWPGLGELASNAAFLLVAIPVTLAIILIFAIGAWIGWTMATTPPPKPIEEIEAELETEEKKEESTTETTETEAESGEGEEKKKERKKKE
ncbi:transcriptional regulator [Candidatus Bathyarchaeota archaeon]|nr:MAG: transcriptional regulator [Candidatus Bathyarchaeota archaeon]